MLVLPKSVASSTLATHITRLIFLGHLVNEFSLWGGGDIQWLLLYVNFMFSVNSCQGRSLVFKFLILTLRVRIVIARMC